MKAFSMTYDLSYKELLMADTKQGLYYSLSTLGLNVAKKLKKSEFADLLESVFCEKPFYIIDRLPKEEQDLLSKLIGYKESK